VKSDNYRNSLKHEGKKDSATLNLVHVRRKPGSRTGAFLSSQTRTILRFLAAEAQGAQHKDTASSLKKENLTFKSFS